jgi:hypothetical protein
VLVLSAEDGVADTIRPRVDRLGGDAARFHVLQAVRVRGHERGFSLSADLPYLEAALERTQASLLPIDPVSAYLGKADSWKDAEVRSVLMPLARLLERRRVAGLGVMHLTKATDRRALYRALGSVAFVAAARSVFAVAKDPENPERRLLLPVKCNIAASPPALAFRVTPQVTLAWEAGPEGLDADAALRDGASAEERTALEEAMDFLHEILADRHEVPVKAILEEARRNSIATITLRRAQRKLGVEKRRQGLEGGGGEWLWRLPAARRQEHHGQDDHHDHHGAEMPANSGRDQDAPDQDDHGDHGAPLLESRASIPDLHGLGLDQGTGRA